MRRQLLEPFRQPFPKTAAQQGGAPVSQGGGKPKARVRNWASTLRRLWRYLAGRKLKLALVLLMVVVSSALALLGPYMIGVAIDRFIDGGGGGWGFFLAGLGSLTIFLSLSTWLQSIWMIGIAQETVYQLRRDLFAQLHRLPIPFFSKRQQGELMSRVTNDIENISSTLNSSAIQVFSSVLTLAGTVSVMLWLSPLLTLITFLVVPLMALGMRWITNRTGPLFKERQRNMGDLNGYVEETLSGQRIIKSFAQEERVLAEFRQRNARIRAAGFWAQTISGFIPKLMNGLNNLSFALIAGAGGILAIQGTITVGVILVFVEYARQFTRPLNDLANQWNTLLAAIAGAERVFEIMDEPVEESDEQHAIEVGQLAGKVQFERVCFGYEAGRSTLRDISFTARPGEMIALVGPTGAGKTTLIQLLSRFYDADGGSILIDGQDIRKLRRASLRSQMAFVLQDTFLFQGTIRDNIRFGRLDATDAEVEEAARLAGAESFIQRMQGGYEKMLDSGGSGISQGQKQLLAISRAILANPSILVLDEATSSIDTVTEITIQQGLRRLMQGRTSLVIAHRLNTIRNADRILVLQGGRLIEQGSHDELLRRGGFYSELYEGQLRVQEGALNG
ncbi:ABC transporter ATP-binding protein [Paenibacillus sp. SYP-B4298]|uniref:ABC transporter ATP-binding protein n=1 Tax=Paenibacillus sp. SYP-B4298 TaxID=2996034 RepID=UPI0022DCF7E6|nr:ABC transporter ATP-binding protein [Paenibacillus sp. SYP-B4298]